MDKQIAVRLPRLLDKDLNEAARLRPRTQTIEQNITPLSTASLMLDDGSGVTVRSFVELYNAKGSAGVYRVSRPEESYGSGERVSLEHAICTLDDAVVPGKGTLTGTPASVLASILEHQTASARGQALWQLGTVEAPDTMIITVDYDGTKTLEALSRAMNEMCDYMLTYDQTVFPWRVNVVKKPEDASCEGRLSRNIRTIRKTIDDSDLCTRLYSDLLDGGYIESDTVRVWGVVEQSITLNDDMPKEDALAYCRQYLENRKNPAVSVELDAVEWYAMTGEPLDRFEIGDICRIALPEYGAVIEERIVAMSYSDAIGRPEAVTVSLANQVVDMSIRTAEMKSDIDSLKNKSTGYGNYIRKNETVIAHLKEENEGFKEVDNKVVKWFSSAQINLDADAGGADVGILATYEETHDLFDQNEDRIAEAELILHGGPDGASAGLIAKVNENEAALTIQATDIGTLFEVKADVADLGKYATVEELSAELAAFDDAISARVVSSEVTATHLEAGTSFKFINDNVYWMTHSHMTGGRVTEGNTYKNYPVYNEGVKVGTVNIPSTWEFTPTWGTKITYLGRNT